MNLVLLDSQDPNASASDAKAFDTRCILRRSHHAPNAPIWFQWRRTLHQCTRDYKHTYHKTGVTHHCKELWQDLHLLSKTFVITHQLVGCRKWSISTCRHLPCQSASDCHEEFSRLGANGGPSSFSCFKNIRLLHPCQNLPFDERLRQANESARRQVSLNTFETNNSDTLRFCLCGNMRKLFSIPCKANMNRSLRSSCNKREGTKLSGRSAANADLLKGNASFTVYRLFGQQESICQIINQEKETAHLKSGQCHSHAYTWRENTLPASKLAGAPLSEMRLSAYNTCLMATQIDPQSCFLDSG